MCIYFLCVFTHIRESWQSEVFQLCYFVFHQVVKQMEQKKLQQANPPAGPAGELKFQPRMYLSVKFVYFKISDITVIKNTFSVQTLNIVWF